MCTPLPYNQTAKVGNSTTLSSRSNPLYKNPFQLQASCGPARGLTTDYVTNISLSLQCIVLNEGCLYWDEICGKPDKVSDVMVNNWLLLKGTHHEHSSVWRCVILGVFLLYIYFTSLYLPLQESSCRQFLLSHAWLPFRIQNGRFI